MAQRITINVEREGRIGLTLNGAPVTAHAGETIATVLLVVGISTFNVTRTGQPRGPYCNMGTCFECQVRVADPGSSVFHWRRACMHPVEAGMTITTGAQLLQASGYVED